MGSTIGILITNNSSLTVISEVRRKKKGVINFDDFSFCPFAFFFFFFLLEGEGLSKLY